MKHILNGLWFFPATILIISFLFNACNLFKRNDEKKIVACVLCDVSTSINSPTSQTLVDNSIKILDYLYNKKARGRFYPIHQNSAVSSTIVSFDFTNQDDSDFIIKQQQLESYFDSIRSNRNNPMLRSTCIFNAIENATSYFQQLRKKKEQYQFELIILSDMIEDCQGIHLQRLAHFPDSIQAVINSLPKLDLSEVNISIILSSSNVTPPPKIRKNFWELVFIKRCDFQEEILQDPQRFYFGVSIPVRLNGD